MPNDKRISLDKGLGDVSDAPATPHRKTDEEDSPLPSSTAFKKKIQDETPILKRSTSATSSSAAKIVNRTGAMPPPPPRTPSRTSGKSRGIDEAAVIRAESPKLTSTMEEADKKLEEEILEVLAIPTSPPVARPDEVFEAQPAFDAGDSIDDFDWTGLEQRYDEKLQDLELKEQAIYQDLARISDMFSVWAEAGQHKEAERSTKRLRTRVAYVQHEDQRLREKREHYLHVVNAFKSALNLLDRN